MKSFNFGDEELARHHESIKRLARRFVASDADAEDVAQETWLALLETPPRRRSGLVGWLRTVARHGALKVAGGERARGAVLRRVSPPEGAPSVLSEISRRSSREAAERLIRRLDEPYREVVRLRFVEELSTLEIAHRLGRTEVAVRSQLSRGLEHLRGRLDPDRRFYWLALLTWPRVRRVLSGVAVAGLIWLGVVTLRTNAIDRAESPVRAGGLETAQLDGAALELDVPDAPPVQRDPLEPTGARAAPMETPLDPVELATPTPPALVHLTGQVLARIDGLARNAEIWGAREHAPDAETLLGHTDETGAFDVELAPGDWTVWSVGVDERPAGGGEHLRVPSAPFRLKGVGTEATVSPRLLIPYANQFHGSVDAAWRDLAGATIVFRPTIGEDAIDASGKLTSCRLSCSCRIDAEGKFELPVRNQGAQTLWIEDDGRVLWSGTVDSNHPVTITVPRPVTVHGRVVDERGEAQAGVAVSLDRLERVRGLETTTDSEGRFLFTDVPALAQRLSASASATSSAVLVLAPHEGEDLALGEVALSASASITGRVTSDGAPLADWRVLMKPARPPRIAVETRTATDGSFAFPACSEGTYRIWALDSTGMACAFADSLPARDPVQIAVSTLAVLRGRLEDHLQTRLMLESTAFPSAYAIGLLDDGSFEVRVPPGKCQLMEVGPHLGKQSVLELDLLPGEQRDVDLPRLGVGSLLVRMHSPGGAGLDPKTLLTLRGTPPFRVQFIPAEIDFVSGIDLLPDGTLVVATLLADDYLFDASTRQYGLIHRAFRVNAGEQTILDVTFVPGHTTRVQCDADRELRPDELVQFELRGPDGFAFDGKAAAEFLRYGTTKNVYRFDRVLVPGPYELRIRSSEGLAGSQRFEVPSPTVTLELTSKAF